MEQLVDILDAQLQELRPSEKDSAGRSFNKVPWKLLSALDFVPPPWLCSVSAWLRTFISRTPTNTHKQMHSLTCTHTFMDTHTQSQVRGLEAGLAPRGSSFLCSSLVITGFGNTGSPDSSTLKELMAMSPPPTQRITLHCWQVWNSPMEPLQALCEKRADLRRTYNSQLLAGPWRDEWQFEKLHCYSDLSRQQFLRKQGDFH